MLKLTAILGASLLAAGTAASADPWKDESGHGRDRDGYSDRYDDDRRGEYRRHRDGDRRHRYRASIPRGHLPPPGMCRVWFDDRPPGQQPAPTSCRRARAIADDHGGRVIRGARRR